jgi:GT2 family glycosyltransferase
MSSIEVCIVAFDNAATIDACIESLPLLGTGVSIALADNHPDQNSVDAARAAAERVGLPIRVVARPDNPGFAVSCNELAGGSRQEWLFFLNPDAAVRTWPGDVVLRPGITAPRIYGSDGRRQYVYGRNRSMVDELSRRLQIRPRERNGMGYVSGAALLVSRGEFVDVGGFDESYFMYYEDIDLCRRVVDRGGTVRIEASFVVDHIGGHSAAKMPGATALRSYESARHFHRTRSGTTLWIDLVMLVDSVARVTARRLGLRVPGAAGARSTLPMAWHYLRTRFVGSARE